MNVTKHEPPPTNYVFTVEMTSREVQALSREAGAIRSLYASNYPYPHTTQLANLVVKAVNE